MEEEIVEYSTRMIFKFTAIVKIFLTFHSLKCVDYGFPLLLLSLQDTDVAPSLSHSLNKLERLSSRL